MRILLKLFYSDKRMYKHCSLIRKQVSVPGKKLNAVRGPLMINQNVYNILASLNL